MTLAPPSSRHTSWSGRARLRLGRCPRRKDRRGSPRFQRGSSRRIQPRSLVRHSPDGLRVGARAGMRYAAESAASPTPPPIRVRPDTLRGPDSLTRAAQTRRGRRICAGACPSAPSKPIFRSKSVALGPKMAPATQFCPKNGLRRRCKAAGNSSRPRGARRDWGRALRPAAVRSPNPRTYFNSPQPNPRCARTAPVSPENA
jgi:hypothetical protein